jgi:outer membrane protein TolC
MKSAWRVAMGLALVICGPLHALGAQDTPPGATVQSLLEIARQRNPDYAAMRFEARVADERASTAGALMDPRFKIELQDITRMGERSPTLLPSEGGATQYSITQDLPWSGKRALKQEIAALDATGAQGRAQQTWSELVAKIKASFLQRYLVQQNQKLANETLALMLQQEKVMQERYAGGLVVQQDITRLHVEHTAMRAELVALGSEWRQSQTRLNTLLARPPQQPLAEPEQLPALPEAAKLDAAILSERLRHSSPLLAAESARVQSAEKSRSLAAKNRYPDFALGISAMQRQGDVKEWGVMLEFNLPVQSRVINAQEREAQAMVDAATTRQEAATNQALSDLSENLIALEGARQTEQLMTYSLMPQADLTWRSALTAYENGKADFTTLLDAQRQIRQARQSQIKAQVEARMRLIEIERLLGEEI